jgi:nicotinate-nucleotide--dimethylbenzimidazole phosphoribosyltransferase
MLQLWLFPTHATPSGLLDNKTKLLGSLDRIEALALQLGEILGTDSPML